MACGTVRYTHDATLFMHETCESQSGDPQQGAGERCTHQNGIHTIHHTAVPLEQMAHVFDTDIALEQEAHKSPNVPTAPMRIPATIGTHQRVAHFEASYVHANTANAPAMAKSIEPTRPSTDFFGEMRGLSLCLPSQAPANKPPVSDRAGRNTSMMACAIGCPLKVSEMMTQLANNGIYNTVSTDTATWLSRE